MRFASMLTIVLAGPALNWQLTSIVATHALTARGAVTYAFRTSHEAMQAGSAGHAATQATPISRVAARSPSLATVDANARAEGNRRTAAVTLGTALFRRVWPAQILKVRIDGIGGNEVAGLALSGVKFHGQVDPRVFAQEVADLVRLSFAAVPVSEVDIWAMTPLDVARGTVVAGDNAQPTSRVVFGATVPRPQAARFLSGLEASVSPKPHAVAARVSAAAERRTFDNRLAAADGIYWNASWKNSLQRVAANAAGSARHVARPDAAKTIRQGRTRRVGVAKRARALALPKVVARLASPAVGQTREPWFGELFV